MEKKELFDMRLNMRRDADKNKAKIMHTLEALKGKGEIKPSMLSKLGINADRFTSQRTMMTSGSNVESHRGRFNPNASQGEVNVQTADQIQRNGSLGANSEEEQPLSAPATTLNPIRK